MNYMNFGVMQMFAVAELILEPAEGELELFPQPMVIAVMFFRVRDSSHGESRHTEVWC